MPGSSIQGKKFIKEWIQNREDIKTIVDVGAGSCTYPKLLGRGYYWKAIEIFEPYVEKFCYDEYYDEVIVGNIKNIELPDGDLIILGDVLEHLTKIDAVKTYYKIQEKYKHIVLSVPVNDTSFGKGKKCFNNKYEIHRSIWTEEELLSLDNWLDYTVTTKRQIGVFVK